MERQKIAECETLPITVEIAKRINVEDLVYAETGGRMGPSKPTYYYLHDDKLVNLIEPNNIDDELWEILHEDPSYDVWHKIAEFDYAWVGFGNKVFLKNIDDFKIIEEKDHSYLLYKDKYRIPSRCHAYIDTIKNKINGFNEDKIRSVLSRVNNLSERQYQKRIENIKKTYWESQFAMLPMWSPRPYFNEVEQLTKLERVLRIAIQFDMVLEYEIKYYACSRYEDEYKEAINTLREMGAFNGSSVTKSAKDILKTIVFLKKKLIKDALNDAKNEYERHKHEYSESKERDA